jgi:hypothetical protein
MNNIGVVAVICVGVLSFAYAFGADPLFIAVGVIALLGYLAFAGGQGYRKKPPEQKRPWYFD